MYLVENLVRRIARVIGWEIGEAISGVIWTIGIALFLICCCGVSVIAVAFQTIFHH